MAKVLYSASISLDGFMAGPGGDMSWLTEYLGPNPDLDGLVDDIGSLLVGKRTFGGDDPNFWPAAALAAATAASRSSRKVTSGTGVTGA